MGLLIPGDYVSDLLVSVTPTTQITYQRNLHAIQVGLDWAF